VPPGTVVYEKNGDDLLPLADLKAVGDRVLVARGATADAATRRSQPRPTARRDGPSRVAG
jgi:hypothetical protein